MSIKAEVRKYPAPLQACNAGLKRVKVESPNISFEVKRCKAGVLKSPSLLQKHKLDTQRRIAEVLSLKGDAPDLSSVLWKLFVELLKVKVELGNIRSQANYRCPDDRWLTCQQCNFMGKLGGRCCYFTTYCPPGGNLVSSGKGGSFGKPSITL
ncbi:hypothetical protein [Catalinimonas niigatensis]|uniref:hypothetical protein n=1 Tax=Catalinimonas niigatensis TaxID=1397264 RepID=UPI0026663C97|nr:hypothetical protein [Catalinimonas niigatensis]WPP49292.1 hypothetical protein PZB72_21725 [Catalinimonas niigatensis]